MQHKITESMKTKITDPAVVEVELSKFNISMIFSAEDADYIENKFTEFILKLDSIILYDITERVTTPSESQEWRAAVSAAEMELSKFNISMIFPAEDVNYIENKFTKFMPKLHSTILSNITEHNVTPLESQEWHTTTLVGDTEENFAS